MKRTTNMRLAIERSAQGPATFPEPGVAERKFRFENHFLGFEGHFPNFPILPAVVQVLTAVTVAEALSQGRLSFVSLENAKFLLQIGPEREVSVWCKRREAAGAPSMDVRLHVPEGLAASFRLVFEESQECT